MVLILDLFDESLVLLQDLLCWDLKDFAYFRLNERLEGSKSKMTAKTKEIITQWLWGDFKLYHHFKRKLKQKIQQFGPKKVQNQIQNLKNLNQELHTNCHGAYTNNTDLKGEHSLSTFSSQLYLFTYSKKKKSFFIGTPFFMASKKVKALSLDSQCYLYGISEPNFFKLMRMKQSKMFS